MSSDIKEILRNFSSSDLSVLKNYLKRSIIKNSFLAYCEYVHRGRWIPATHLELVCRELQKIADGKLKRLMIFMPPQHGKSMTVSETFPSYFLGHNPKKRVICVSYGETLAKQFGGFNKNKLVEFGKELFNVDVSQSQSSKTDWNLSNNIGGMLSVGIGGGITGKGADLMIIDDPVKNSEEASSKVMRDKVWGEWQHTISTRVHSDAAIIVIMTRWHEDDLCGRLLNPENGHVDDWEVLSLPAIAEANDLLERPVGAPLWDAENGFSLEDLLQKKQAVGSQAWASLYQQRPSPESGNILKREWWKFYKIPPAGFDEIIQSWDLAFKGGDNNDYVCGQVWGRISANKYLLDQFRAKIDFPTTLQAIRSLSAKWSLAKCKLIEDKANGPAVIATLKNEISGIIAINPEGGKIVRAQAVSPGIEAGNVYLPDPSICPWMHDFIEECSSFPNCAHDDQVDAMTQALNRFDNQKKGGTYKGFERLINIL